MEIIWFLLLLSWSSIKRMNCVLCHCGFGDKKLLWGYSKNFKSWFSRNGHDPLLFCCLKGPDTCKVIDLLVCWISNQFWIYSTIVRSARDLWLGINLAEFQTFLKDSVFWWPSLCNTSVVYGPQASKGTRFLSKLVWKETFQNPLISFYWMWILKI